MGVTEFITKWRESGGSERANYQAFLIELCDVIGVAHPDASKPDAAANRYAFERSLSFTAPDGAARTGFIDLYKADCFVLETKQGVNAVAATPDGGDAPGLDLPDAKPARASTGHGKRGTPQWDDALEKAYNQARRYIRRLPAGEGRPPFLIVVDVGYIIELYSEFTCTGGEYVRFPDPRSHRILLDDLEKPEVRELLKTVWTDPQSLDPAKRSARVTREIAARLAELAKSLEAAGHSPDLVARFLQQCIFTMFAEDVSLIPKDSFTRFLESMVGAERGLPTMFQGLWKDMNNGTPFSATLRDKVLHFNGGLFEDPAVVPLAPNQLLLLIDAAKRDWTEVEPAIFGTLLERALSPGERHKLGAHYTPRAYVERLVFPTIIDPLRQQWADVKTAAAQLERTGAIVEARDQVRAFHHELCRLRVLDPACGSGNFLYVTLEHLKRLEAEVLERLEQLGETQATLELDTFKIRPNQFLGLEINPRAVPIAELVLWIGYLRWQLKTAGRQFLDDPVIPTTHSIRQCDAVLEYDEKIERRDPDTGRIMTVWDGVSTKTHPVTGKEVPDESQTKILYDYINPRRPEWPEADYIIGNPPFIGNKRMRDALGDGYVESLRMAAGSKVPKTADFVMYWWQRCAEVLAGRQIRSFGLITTNSIKQSLNRGVLSDALESAKKPISISFAIQDHPWVDSADGAGVRISMTAARQGITHGQLARVINETDGEDGEINVDIAYCTGSITDTLQVGPATGNLAKLQSNEDVSFQGIIPLGEGFKLTEDELSPLGLDEANLPLIVRQYIGGSDLVQVSRKRWIIDFFGLTEREALSTAPELYQRVRNLVKPKRDQNKRQTRRENWWLYGENAPKLRRAITRINRYIGTPDTSKFKPFVFIPAQTLPDVGVYSVATDDAFVLGTLSSIVHQDWLKAVAPTLEDRPRWKPAIVFDPFPFPDPTDAQKARIRELGERLDAHRKARQAEHPDLTLTGMYNVLEKLRAEEPLNEKERDIHDRGLVTVLKDIHDQLDAAVLEAYGWADLMERARTEAPEVVEQEILQRLVDLNHERAAEEAGGKIRWLRPEFQCPESLEAQPATETQTQLPGTEAPPMPTLAKAAAKKAALKWPKELPEQVAAIRSSLSESPGSDAATLSGLFGRKAPQREKRIEEILKTLADLGQLEAA